VESVKKFFQWTLRISAVIVLTILLLFVSGWFLYKGYEGYGELKSKGLAKAKTWDSLTVESLNAGFILRTKWQNDEMLYKMEVKFKDEKSRTSAPGIDKFSMLFYDEDGFKIFEERITRSSVSGKVDDSGKIVAVEIEGSMFLGEQDYRRADEWNVSWTSSE
jgi:hypothetical protein